MEPVAVVIWIVIATLVLALFAWWYLGVHRKSRVAQAAERIAADAARKARPTRWDENKPSGMPPKVR